MGQTLTHGVYLPNEGERNCYDGLASNWSILDGAVGTVAEHTSALSGKAPLVHTHTKSDVTDLLNSNFIPSANNSYDLGSSSYQWNSLYAKNYFYNGTPWGLDKQNEWTNFQRMTSNPAVWYLRNNTVTLGSVPSSNRYIGMFFEDVNGADLGYVSFQANKNSYNSIMFSLRNYDGTNAYTGVLRYRASTTGAYCFFPETSECDLGISTNKWKTLNGINPGALSLPNVRAAEADPISTVGWNLSGSRNKYTPTEDGWFYIRVAGTGSCAINIHNGDTDNSYPTWFNTSTGGYATLVVPCEKGISLYIYISATSIEYCSFHPCLGNV